MQETWVRSLGWKDPLEQGLAYDSSRMDRGVWQVIVYEGAQNWTRLWQVSMDARQMFTHYGKLVCVFVCVHVCYSPSRIRLSVIPYLQSLLKFLPIELVRPSNHLILCHLLLLLPSVFPNLRVFSYESAFHLFQSCGHS